MIRRYTKPITTSVETTEWWTTTIARCLTLYRIRRDHSNTSRAYVIDVPETHQRGFGMQINIRGVLYGLAFHTRGACGA